MEFLRVILIPSIFFFFLRYGINLYRKRRLPPGPIGLSVIGNLLAIRPKPHESLAMLAHKHGPDMTIRLGSITSVVVSTPDTAREILQRKDEICSSRPVPNAVADVKNLDAEILWMPPNETWRTMRKALNVYLTNKQKLDNLSELRQNVVGDMLVFLCRRKEPVDIGKLAFVVALNQLSNTILSQDLTTYEADNIGRFKVASETVMEMQGRLNISDIFPVLKPFDLQNIRKQTTMAFESLHEVLEGFISERLKHRDLKLPSFGDMDSLLDYAQENEDMLNLTQIKALLVDLFIAGTDTVTNTITWAMTEMLINPDMLSRAREEISQIVGADGKITEARISELSYLQAFIKETMRHHFSVPLLAPHKTEMEVKVGSYIIPANTQVLVNAWAMSRDSRYWDSPMVFMPERFLKNKLDYKGQYFEYIPFGSGRRRCPGMALADRMVCLLLATFVYHFDWKLPYAKEEMDMNDKFGLTLQKATPLVATAIPLKLAMK